MRPREKTRKAHDEQRFNEARALRPGNARRLRQFETWGLLLQ